MDKLLEGLGLMFAIIGYGVAITVVLWGFTGFTKFWKD